MRHRRSLRSWTRNGQHARPSTPRPPSPRRLLGGAPEHLRVARGSGPGRRVGADSERPRRGRGCSMAPAPDGMDLGVGVPLETVRFAAANRLCIELRYQGTSRVVEPYSLRRSTAGSLLLRAVKADTRQVRSYRVDRIEGLRVMTRTFRPVYHVEFWRQGHYQLRPSTSPEARRVDDPRLRHQRLRREDREE